MNDYQFKQNTDSMLQMTKTAEMYFNVYVLELIAQ